MVQFCFCLSHDVNVYGTFGTRTPRRGQSPALPPGVGLLPGLSGGPVRELGCSGVSSVVKAVKGGVRSLPNKETIQEKREWKTEQRS